MYGNGQGVPEDLVEALRWFRLAAEQGHAEAQNNIGRMFLDGKGVLQDHALAYMWFNLAAASGHNDGVKNRDEVFAILTPEERAKAQEMSRTCFEAGYKNCGY